MRTLHGNCSILQRIIQEILKGILQRIMYSQLASYLYIYACPNCYGADIQYFNVLDSYMGFCKIYIMVCLIMVAPYVGTNSSYIATLSRDVYFAFIFTYFSFQQFFFSDLTSYIAILCSRFCFISIFCSKVSAQTSYSLYTSIAYTHHGQLQLD